MNIANAAPASNPVLDRVRASLGDAQQVAADVYNAPAQATMQQIADGMGDAATAAALLMGATPDSKFQDLGAAATLANAGVRELGRALSAVPGKDLVAIKTHADGAFTAIDHALEILTNN